MNSAAMDYMTPAELRKVAMEVLYEKLGPANFIRFINQTEKGYGDYTASKGELWGDATLDEIASQLEAMENE